MDSPCPAFISAALFASRRWSRYTQAFVSPAAQAARIGARSAATSGVSQPARASAAIIKANGFMWSFSFKAPRLLQSHVADNGGERMTPTPHTNPLGDALGASIGAPVLPPVGRVHGVKGSKHPTHGGPTVQHCLSGRVVTSLLRTPDGTSSSPTAADVTSLTDAAGFLEAV